MWSIIPTLAILIAQAQPSPPPKWCFERTQGALLCEETEDACNLLRSINTEIATSPCKRVEPPPPPSPEKQTPNDQRYDRRHNIAIIRQACIKANPEIMELKPGCLVRDFLKGGGIVMGVEKNAGGADCYDIFYTETDPEVIWQQPRTHLDVLGRPIRLADVLLAMEPIGCTTYAADRLLNFYMDLDSDDVRWNLRADDLTRQSDECLTFLVALLEPDDQ